MGLWILRGVPGAIAALSINTCPSVTAHPARVEPMTYRGRPGAVSDDVDGEPGQVQVPLADRWQRCGTMHIGSVTACSGALGSKDTHLV